MAQTPSAGTLYRCVIRQGCVPTGRTARDVTAARAWYNAMGTFYVTLDAQGVPHAYNSTMDTDAASEYFPASFMQGHYTQVSSDNRMGSLAFLDEDGKIHVLQHPQNSLVGSAGYVDLTDTLTPLASGTYLSVSVSASYYLASSEQIKTVDLVAVDSQGQLHWFSANYTIGATSATWVDKTDSENFKEAAGSQKYVRADLSFRHFGRDSNQKPDAAHEDDATLALLDASGSLTWMSKYGGVWDNQGMVPNAPAKTAYMDYYMIDQNGTPQMFGLAIDTSGTVHGKNLDAHWGSSTNDGFLTSNAFSKVSLAPWLNIKADNTAEQPNMEAWVIAGTPTLQQLDNTPPVISGATDKTIQINDPFDPRDGVTATDDTDGDITSRIQISGQVDNQTAGQYTLTYTVTDIAGNQAAATRTITVLSGGTTIACAPQTGDPAASLWQWSSLIIGLLTIGLGLYASMLRKRMRSRRNL